MKTYFITGATGVVGSTIVEALLSDQDTRLKLLIRARDGAELASRLAGLYAFWGRSPDSVGSRVQALRGDTTAPRFGLGAADYDALAESCTHVIHCAAIVRMNLPLDEARASAVGAARNVIALATQARTNATLEKVEFLSTVGVGGRRPGVLPETWITEPRTFHNSYEQAKADAEVTVADAARAGLPITVHRPSMVVGDSKTGKISHFQIFYHLVEFLSGRRTFGLYPHLGEASIDLVPANYVAQAVIWSSRNSSTCGQILHLCSGPGGALPLAKLRLEIRNRFAAEGLALPRPIAIPTGTLRAALPLVRMLMPKSGRRALSTLPIFLDYLADSQSFGNARTRALLEKAGIDLPPAEAFLTRVLDYYLAHRPAVQ